MPSAIIMCFEFGLLVWSFHWSFGTCRTSYWNVKKWQSTSLHERLLHNSFPSKRYNFAFQQFDFRLDNCKYGCTHSTVASSFVQFKCKLSGVQCCCSIVCLFLLFARLSLYLSFSHFPCSFQVFLRFRLSS